ncbi:MAG: PfkB family carbohydrate kinase [Candidatus Abyssubacteria bacterium]
METPEFLAVGHLCLDLMDGRKILGGSASYASLTARALGCRVGIVTSLSEDFPFLGEFREIEIQAIPSPSTTTFRNVYHNGVREQFISGVAAQIGAEHVPDSWTGAEIVYLCPIADEVLPDVPARFGKSSLIGVGAQGWFRKWDDSGRVRQKRWSQARDILPHVHVVIYSELDLDEPYAFAEEVSKLTPIVIVTQSCRGAEVFVDRQRIHVPAFDIREIDPTGAGDVFAAAFLVRYRETCDAVESAKFACCAASFVCEKEGTKGTPTRDQVEERLKAYNKMRFPLHS